VHAPAVRTAAHCRERSNTDSSRCAFKKTLPLGSHMGSTSACAEHAGMCPKCPMSSMHSQLQSRIVSALHQAAVAAKAPLWAHQGKARAHCCNEGPCQHPSERLVVCSLASYHGHNKVQFCLSNGPAAEGTLMWVELLQRLLQGQNVGARCASTSRQDLYCFNLVKVLWSRTQRWHTSGIRHGE